MKRRGEGFWLKIPNSLFEHAEDGADILLDEILNCLPESLRCHPEEMLTEQSERFLVSEMIRENVIQQSYPEIPCSTAVTIRDLKEHLDGNPVIIKGTVHSPPPVGLKVIFL